jgi:hypothetical protein
MFGGHSRRARAAPARARARGVAAATRRALKTCEEQGEANSKRCHGYSAVRTKRTSHAIFNFLPDIWTIRRGSLVPCAGQGP